MKYYSERTQGAGFRIREDIDSRLWGGIIAAIQTRVDSGAFGHAFPLNDCVDVPTAVIGTDSHTMGMAILAEIPSLTQTETGMESAGWPLCSNYIPPVSTILDLIEFCHWHVADVEHASYHDFFGHQHLTFDKEPGQHDFREKINMLFRRNGSTYNMNYYGVIQHIGPSVITTIVKDTVFRTGDYKLDTLLEQAREKYLDGRPHVRIESLYALWDALERMKTIRHEDKRKGTQLLLSAVTSNEALVDIIDTELSVLTGIGNSFQIRHHEVGKVGVDSHDVDYLFHRAFATVAHLLKLKVRGRT